MKFETLQFQDKAVEIVLKAIGTYLNENVEKVRETTGVLKPLIGKDKPYLHRIKAITGAGKTPILASLGGELQNALILWTTPQSAVIEQTTAALEGKYKHLIGESATILPLASVVYEDQTWQYEVLQRTVGVTILTTTVAFFNQEGRDNLRFRKGHYDKQLKEERSRPLWVFYDEGHNLGENQLSRLLELAPTGIILASASPLSVDLQDLLPGYNKADRESAIIARTYEIPTRKVVENHLLKRKIEIHDLNTAEDEILRASYRKREHLQRGADLPIIACYMMNSADKGREALELVWKKLLAFGANPREIAVHLSGAKNTARTLAEAQGKSVDEVFPHLQCTYEDGLTPDQLRAQGFKHLIWNKAMQEGWDEPNAYVGYFHGLQVDETQVTQRIGRLVRNPYKDQRGVPCPAPSQELSTTYLYLNVQDSILAKVVKNIQEEMLGSKDDLSFVHEEEEDFDQYKIPPKEVKELNLLKIECQQDIEKALIIALFKTSFGPDDKEAPGVEKTGTIEIGEKGDVTFKEETLATNAPITVEKAVKLALRRRDKRLLNKVSSGSDSTGPWIGESTWQDPRFQEKIPLGCAQHVELESRCSHFVHNDLPGFIEVYEDPHDTYRIGGFTVNNPNGGKATARKKIYYQVESFKNSIHREYNGMNGFEREVAYEIDSKGYTWARNPPKTGYGIPLRFPSRESRGFYPDFIVWKGDQILFIEPKGEHLLEESKKGKLLTLPKGMKIAILTKAGDKIKLVTKQLGDPHEQEFDSLQKCINHLL